MINKWQSSRQFLALTIWKSKIYDQIKFNESQTIEKNFHRLKNGEFERNDKKGNIVLSEVNVYLRKLMKTCFIAIFDNRCRMQYGKVQLEEMRDKLRAMRGRNAV